MLHVHLSAKNNHRSPGGTLTEAALGEISSITRQMIRGSQNYDSRLGVICGCGTTIGKRSTNEDVHDIRLNEVIPLVSADSVAKSLPYSYFAVYDGSLSAVSTRT